jgi:molybdopterin converting factor small subunit
MQVQVSFYSYFKDLAGCAQTTVTLPEGASIEELLAVLASKLPKFAPARNAALAAVGVDYQPRGYKLKADDEVALFPPVQGG